MQPSLFVDALGEEIELMWNREGALQAEENVFIGAFYETYSNMALNELGIDDIFRFLQDTFSVERRDIAEQPDSKYLKWVSAIKEKDHVVGFALFESSKEMDEIYIRQLAVCPHQRHRGIGRRLVYSAQTQFPHARKLVLVTRVQNRQSIDFFGSIGFQHSTYMHERYNPAQYCGFELVM